MFSSVAILLFHQITAHICELSTDLYATWLPHHGHFSWFSDPHQTCPNQGVRYLKEICSICGYFSGNIGNRFSRFTPTADAESILVDGVCAGCVPQLIMMFAGTYSESCLRGHATYKSKAMNRDFYTWSCSLK